MIPKEGQDLINLHLEQARKTDREDFAVKMLANAEAILGYALACSQLSCGEYGEQMNLIKLVRAQRLQRASAHA